MWITDTQWFKQVEKDMRKQTKKASKRIRAKTVKHVVHLDAEPAVKEEEAASPSTTWTGFSGVAAAGLYVMRSYNQGIEDYAVVRVLGINRGYGQFFRVEGVHTYIVQNSTFQKIKD